MPRVQFFKHMTEVRKNVYTHYEHHWVKNFDGNLIYRRKQIKWLQHLLILKLNASTDEHHISRVADCSRRNENIT